MPSSAFGFSSLVLAAAGFVLATTAVAQQKKYDPGATDTEIKLGQTMPVQRPGSAYGTIGKRRSRTSR